MIRFVLSDLDGTLINKDKELAPATIRAVRALHRAGIDFSIVSGRPPLGLRFVVPELGIRVPVASFNGGMLLKPDLKILERLCIGAGLSRELIAVLRERGLDAWYYRGLQWFVRDPKAPHVDRERDTVKLDPVVVTESEPALDEVVKIVGVSDDHELVARTEAEFRETFKGKITAARSQDYYLDITHPRANKGAIVRRFAALLSISPEEIATLGDMPSDVGMFAESGLSFAVGNADAEVKAKATRVVASNDEDGFAQAVDLILESKENPAWLKKAI